MNYNSRNMLATSPIEPVTMQHTPNTKISANDAELIMLGKIWGKQHTKCKKISRKLDIALDAVEKDVEHLVSKYICTNETTREVTRLTWEKLDSVNSTPEMAANAPWAAASEKYRSAKRTAHCKHLIDELDKTLQDEWNALDKLGFEISHMQASSVRGITVKLSIWYARRENEEFGFFEKFVVSALEDLKRLN